MEGLDDPAAYAEWRRRKKEEVTTHTLVEWEEEWRVAPHGRWTHRLIPSVSEWIAYNVYVDFYVTQLMTGHGSIANAGWRRERGFSIL